MRIVRSEDRWRLVAFERTVHDCLERLALQKGYRVDAFCEELGLSGRYLRELFLRDVGLAPKEWMQWERMVVARRMMVWGIEAPEVAEKVGFSDANSFRREFRMMYGIAPLRYLELRRADDFRQQARVDG